MINFTNYLLWLGLVLKFTSNVICEGSTSSPSCFRAAVLDHVPQRASQNSGVRANIDLNLQMYERATRLAKQNGADIVVFAEAGIITGARGRADLLHYGENIPNLVVSSQHVVQNSVEICSDAFKVTHPIIHRLACLAKQEQMFLVADLIDVQDCHQQQQSSTKCSSDGKNVFNTAVLFDRQGRLLAKYHKIHPWGEAQLNAPPSPNDELLIVNTELGRLSLQICFDMIFETPGVALAAQNRIDTMLFPTLWFNEPPFLSAGQYQMGWSYSNRVNLLASNFHHIEVGNMGSGIYSGQHGRNHQFEVINVMNDSNARLLVATLPKHPSNVTEACALNPKTFAVPQLVPQNAANHKYNVLTYMDLTDVDIVPLDLHQQKADQNQISKCHKGVCCHLSFVVDSSSLTLSNADDKFYLILANRTRPGNYHWTEEFCALVHCSAIYSAAKCASPKASSHIEGSPRFLFAELSGEFSRDTSVYPSAVGQEFRQLKSSLAQENSVLWSTFEEPPKSTDVKKSYGITFGDKTKTVSTSPLTTLGLYGRVYNRDPPFVHRTAF